MVDDIIEELRQLRPDIPVDCMKCLLDILRDLNQEYPSSTRTLFALSDEVDFVLASLIICTPSKARREVIDEFKKVMLRRGYSEEQIEGRVRRVEERLDEINGRHPRDFILFVVRKVGEKECLSGVDDEEIRKIVHGAWELLEYTNRELQKRVAKRFKLSPLVTAASAVLLSARYVACRKLSEQCLAQALCLPPDLVSEVAYELWEAYKRDSTSKATKESLQKLRREACREEPITERPQADIDLSSRDVEVAIKDVEEEATLPAAIEVSESSAARELREAWRGVSMEDSNELFSVVGKIVVRLATVTEYRWRVGRGLSVIERQAFSTSEEWEPVTVSKKVAGAIGYVRDHLDWLARQLDSEVGGILQAVSSLQGKALDLEGLKRELESLASELADVPKKVNEILGIEAGLKELGWHPDELSRRRDRLKQYVGELMNRVKMTLGEIDRLRLEDVAREAHVLTLKLYDLTVRTKEKPEGFAVRLESLVREGQLREALALAAILDVLCERLNKEKGTRLPTGNLEKVKRIAEELGRSHS